MVSTSIFLLKNWAHTKNERKGKNESSKGFFEDHRSYTRVGDERCFNLEKKDTLYTFFCERVLSTVYVLTFRGVDNYQDSIPLTDLALLSQIAISKS